MIATTALIGMVSELLPKAVGLFTGGDSKAEKAVGIAVDIAESITGKKGDDAFAEIGGSPELKLEFQKALMADAHIEAEMAYKDRENAREMYKHHHGMQDGVAKSIMKYNLPLVLILVIVNVTVGIYLPDGMQGEAQSIGTLIGFIINSLLKERQDLIGFNFGSSTGSKLKSGGM